MTEPTDNPIVNAHIINMPMVHAAALKTMEASMSSPDAVAGEIPEVNVQLTAGEYIVPQVVTPEQVRCAVYAYLAEKPDLASDFLDTMTITDSQCFYVPAYQCQGSYQAEWQVHVGYIPYITCCAESDEDNLMWHPENGQLSTQYTAMVYAGSRLPPDTIQMLATADVQNQTTPFDEKHFQGNRPESYAGTLQQIHDNVGCQQIARVIDTRIRQECTEGDGQKWWKWQIDEIDCHAQKVWMPVGRASIEYKGRNYIFWCSGADSRHAICSALPAGAGKTSQSVFGWLPMAVCAAITIMGYLLLGNQTTIGFLAIMLITPLAYGLYRLLSIQAYERNKGDFLNAIRSLSRIGVPDECGFSLPRLPKRPWIIGLIPYDKIGLPGVILVTVIAAVAYQLIRY